VFDDISGDLKVGNSVAVFMKQHRHYKAKVVVSSQYPTDLPRSAREQLDIWCLFRGFGRDKMMEIFPQIAISDLEFEDFYKLYKRVTREPHNFLYINRKSNELRKNFNEKIIFNRSE